MLQRIIIHWRALKVMFSCSTSIEASSSGWNSLTPHLPGICFSSLSSTPYASLHSVCTFALISQPGWEFPFNLPHRRRAFAYLHFCSHQSKQLSLAKCDEFCPSRKILVGRTDCKQTIFAPEGSSILNNSCIFFLFNDTANHSVTNFTRAQLQPVINVATEVNKPMIFFRKCKTIKSNIWV